MKKPNITEEWNLGEFEECGGYDCMTAGIRIGPAELDGARYGQKSCETIKPEVMTKMLADARFIAAVKDMAETLEFYANPQHYQENGMVSGDGGYEARQALKNAGYEF